MVVKDILCDIFLYLSRYIFITYLLIVAWVHFNANKLSLYMENKGC